MLRRHEKGKPAARRGRNAHGPPKEERQPGYRTAVGCIPLESRLQEKKGAGMLKSAASKLMWLGRTASMVFGLALVMALVLGAASMAFGANGGTFILGKLNNAATAVTGLVGNVDGAAALRVTNPNSGTNDTALDLRVQAGEAPMKVNSNTRVANLNAASAGRADSAASADTATNAQNATNAGNADQLDGKDSAEFANATHAHSGADINSGTVAEARIDNSIARDSEVSNSFIQGRGAAKHRAQAISPGSNVWFWQMSDSDLWISYDCRSDLASNGFVGLKNTSGTETVNVFSDNGDSNPSYRQLAPGEFFSQGAAAAGEHITFQVQGTYVATIEVFSVHRTSDNKCHVQAQTLITKP